MRIMSASSVARPTLVKRRGGQGGEVLKLRGSICRYMPWELTPDLFFYSDPRKLRWRRGIVLKLLLSTDR